ENVRRQYPDRPFDAVITIRDEDGIKPCLVVGEFFEDDPNWDVPRGFVIERTAEAIARVAGPLVMNSREVVFVDPYFDPTVPEWRNPLTAILEEATRGGRVLRRCELHSRVQRDPEGPIYDNATFGRLCGDHLPEAIPEGVQLVV